MAHVAPISVVIADDHPIVRAGIVGMLGKAADVRVVAETGDGARVERLAVEHAPKIVCAILDSLPSAVKNPKRGFEFCFDGRHGDNVPN